VKQYEISNFAREGPQSLSGWLGKDNHGDSDSSSQNDASKRAEKEYRSRHNMKYWRREPYVGFGLDAHSMRRSGAGGVRWANGDDLSRYEVQGSRFEVLGPRYEGPEVELVGTERAFEEAMFLGLRMNEGVELEALRAEFGEELMGGAVEALGDVEEAGLVIVEGGRVKLTASGRMASNEVFSRLLVGAAV
jgi:oxygen-independent coproporphyrinogen-3 oxidase